ncbi:GFA family protein [Sphingomonas jaspsi]|uniref:GFA family protein n=1 Tax=Sphingomonas jaspsi TaxID=392409 RepID=UPI0004B41545|nr:GFA family protein [Sphingomonas jaspsi]
MLVVRGGCHCKAVRFTAKLPDPPVPALDCNCSICAATGFLHIIVPHEDFTLESGESALTHYRFGTGAADHLFCKICGIKSFYQPRSHPDAWSVNANALDEPVDLSIEQFDGKNWERAKANLDGANGAD